MNGKTHKIRRAASAFALVASVAVVAVPAALAAPVENSQGMVPSKLGSPDPRDSAQKVPFSPSIVASRLGSDASRNLAVKDAGDFIARDYLYGTNSNGESGIIASRLGSPDVRDIAPPRGAAIGTNGLNGDFMFRDYLRGTHWAVSSPSIVASRLGSPDTRDAFEKSYGYAMLTDLSGMHSNALGAAPVVGTTQVASDDGVNWGKVGIWIAVAVCGLLLLVALGIGARQVRHGGHRLGSA